MRTRGARADWRRYAPTKLTGDRHCDSQGRCVWDDDYISRKGSSAASLAVCDRKFESVTPTSRTLFGGGKPRETCVLMTENSASLGVQPRAACPDAYLPAVAGSQRHISHGDQRGGGNRGMVRGRKQSGSWLPAVPQRCHHHVRRPRRRHRQRHQPHRHRCLGGDHGFLY